MANQTSIGVSYGVCSLLDIQLDARKTYQWACTAQGRQQIRDSNGTLVTAIRNLCAHMQFDSRQTNATVTAKFRSLPDLWHQLAKSQAPYDQKIKILRTVAWPRAMYSISTVHIGNAYFVDARAGAFNALGCTKPEPTRKSICRSLPIPQQIQNFMSCSTQSYNSDVTLHQS